MPAMSAPPPAAGGTPSAGELYQSLEQELHAIAAQLLARERANHTLQPTALLHEAWLRLARVHQPWQDQGHFLRAAAGTMRRVLVEHARGLARDKRQAGGRRLTLSTELLDCGREAEDLLAVDDALGRLGALDPELARIVELRVFGGLSHQEIASALESSVRSVERGWRLARAFLAKVLQGGDAA
jgi:RNA polymerase sigma factor (TIGR02999 family)